MMMKRRLLLLLFCVSHFAWAQTVVLNPVQDNTLYEQPNGSLSNGSGTAIFAGNTNNGDIRRALLQFDLSSIPANATITAATLTLSMNQTIAGATTMNLHKVNASWGEGSSIASGQQGSGGTSQPNDATWLHRFFQSTLWTTPGGDFSPTSSASTSVGGNGNYNWTSAQLAADVQGWLNAPATNFGWILLGNEGVTPSAKRFVSREGSAASRPKLTISYTVPCQAPAIPTLSAGSTSICPGSSTTIQATGALNDATAWHLYTGSCGGTFVASSASGQFSVAPSVTTTYFVRGEGGCVTPGNCASITITVLPLENAGFSWPLSMICQDSATLLPTITGVAGGTFSAGPIGLALNASTGAIDLAASQPGTYQVSYTTPGTGCQNSSTQVLTILPAYNQILPVTLCDGDTFVLGNQILTLPGSYTEAFVSKDGCDSVVTIQLSFAAGFTKNQTATICQGETFDFGGQLLDSAGTYTRQILSTTGGCDTTLTLVLTVGQPAQSSSSASLCAGESLVFGTQTIDTAGTFVEVFSTALGCDSTVVLNVTLTTLDTSVVRTGDNTVTAQASGVSYSWVNCETLVQDQPGDTLATFSAGQVGNYFVVVSDGTCSDTSECFFLTGQNISVDDEFQASMKLYPNPTHGEVTLAFSEWASEPELMLFTSQGQLVRTWDRAQANEITLNISDLPAGLYLLQVRDGDRQAIWKLRKD